ncbi:P-loop containing nucleoside triphosphate hydrolase protein [Byssothecium circinans]|uniref:ATP-dependent RNA helicase ROK1 n=1 Tax=Byssothecium circinans TaxID=147558 RepID=A0A6A5TQD0_9PLEO|nr:P-loop containing nucleoside triphosphate hydrolase protein [Byssothecium circinans]
MNVFKLLSRSSKAPQSAPTQSLPSGGAATNPQLFGRNEPKAASQDTKKTRKRKRGQDNTESSAPLPADLDFFGDAPKVIAEDEDAAVSKESKKDKRADTTEEQEGGEDPAIEAYNEDEAKRILRSHRLKITVLEDFAPPVEELEKKKKKRRKEKASKVEKKKDVKKQLYPLPLSSFAQLRPRYNISRRLAENLQEQGYTVPTEVQLATLPLLLEKKKANVDGNASSGAEYGGDVDLLTVAPTGSGKTIAFLIPIINALLSEKSDNYEGPRAIVVAPTRELASQIANEARKLSKNTGIKATLMMKGMEVVDRSEGESPEEDEQVSEEALENEGQDSASDSDPETKQLQPKKRRRRAVKVKADILIATPLALLNPLKKKDGTIAKLPSIRRFILDEADVLLDPLFREQTLELWNACTNPLLRIGLWSATMGSNIEALAISTLNTRWTSLSSTSTTLPPRPPLIRLVVGLKDSAIPNVSHQLTYAATEQGKLLGLRQLLHPTALPSNSSTPSLRPPFLVFTQTIPRAIALHSELLYDIPHEAGGSTRLAVLHADLSSSAREAIMTRFRRGEIWVLITTDLLARGVDFRGLNGVVNYDVPNSAAAYVHRVGRTGRAGREGGVAVTFYTREDVPYIKLIANVIRASEKMRGVKGGEESIKQWLLDALPAPTKREKQLLKKRGVEARRTPKNEGGGGKERAKTRISTKSGFVRRMENNRKGARMASARKGEMDGRVVDAGTGSGSGVESEFEGFD